MKKALSIMLAALMLVSAFSMLAIGAAAEEVPSGQIWEGESDLVFSDFVNSGSKAPTGFGGNFESSGKMSQNGILLWEPGSVGEYLEFSLQVETEGKKTLMFQYLKAHDLGIFDVYFDGKLVLENLDMYVPVEERGMVELNLGEMDITKGVHKLKFVYKGKNADSAKPQLGVDYVELVGEDGVRRFVNVDVVGDDYKKITRFEDGTVRYEIETMEQTLFTQYKKYKLSNQTYKNGWDTDIPWSYTAHLFWENGNAGDEASFRFFVDKSGEYEINFHVALADGRGIAEIQIDSAPLVTIDQYSETLGGVQFGPDDDKTIMLKAGYHTLTLVHKGKNPVSKNTQISLDFMELKRVGIFIQTGQIWEGETELLGYGTGVKYDINGTEYEISGPTSVSGITLPETEVKENNHTWANSEMGSGDNHFLWKPGVANASVEFTLDVKTTGKKDVYFQYISWKGMGKYKVTLRAEGAADDDTILEKEIDLYDSVVVYKEEYLGQVEVGVGKYILRFENNDKNNAATTHYGLSIDYFELVGEDGVRRTQKYDERGSDFDRIYYADDGTVRYIVWDMPVDKKTQENLDSGVYTKNIETNGTIKNGGFVGGLHKLVLKGLEDYVGTQEKPEYTVRFYVDKNGYYSVSAGMTNFIRSSLLSFKINGTPVGEVIDPCNNLRSASFHNLTPSLYLKKGWNTFTIVFEGKAPANTAADTRMDFDFFEIRNISTGEPFEIDPECTPETGDATFYVVLALAVSAMALAIPAVTWAKKKNASK